MTEPLPSSGTQPIVLKKYGNRRLYDTHASRYITLQEVEEMLQRGTDVKVMDAKTGDDLTKEILVQIILDKENAREMLPTSFLKQVVRLSSSPLRDSFTRALQDSLDTLVGGQRAMVDAQRAFLQQLPYAGAWNPFAAFAGPPPAAPSAAPPPKQESAELDRLRSEVSETQALLRQLLQQKNAPEAPPRRARRTRRSARA